MKKTTMDELHDLYSGKLPDNCKLELMDEANNQAIFSKDNHYYLQSDLKKTDCYEIVPVSKPFDDITIFNYTRDNSHVQKVEMRMNDGTIFDEPLRLKNEQIENGMSCSMKLKDEDGKESTLTLRYENDEKLSVLYQNKKLDVEFQSPSKATDLLKLLKLARPETAKETFSHFELMAETVNQGKRPLANSFHQLAELVENADVEPAVSKDDFELIPDPESFDFYFSKSLSVAFMPIEVSDSALEYLMHENQILDISKSLLSARAEEDDYCEVFANITVNENNEPTKASLRIFEGRNVFEISLDEATQNELMQALNRDFELDNSSISQKIAEEKEAREDRGRGMF